MKHHQNTPSQTKIVVAMSGGVDSSVVAALLHEQGHNVVGVTLQLYDHGAMVQKKKACCAGQDIYDAREVAAQIGIPHYVLDYESVFKQEVMDDFADSYIRGETPIPCVKCNQSVKFRDLFKVAKDLGADALATGHYVQRIDHDGKAELHRGADPEKDQSYFLFATTQDQLDFLIFPLGGLSKDITREHAKRFGLKVSHKPDSQDICFVPEGGYTDVLLKLRPGACESGDIVYIDGTVLGKHEGIIHYTIGQRRGLALSSHEPLYVIRLEPETRQVIVGPRSALGAEDVYLRDVNWLGGEVPQEGRQVQVKLRSMHKPVSARYFPGIQGQATVVLDSSQDAVTPGQACVIYDGSRVLGGGWIKRQELK